MPSNPLILCRPLLLLPSNFPASGSFQMIQLFPLGGQSIGASASPSVLPMSIQNWLPLGLTDLISLLYKGFSRVSTTTVQKHPLLGAQSSLWSNSHIHTWRLENHNFDYTDFVNKVKYLLFFNVWSKFVIAFLPRRKHLLILWLQSLSTVILEPRK